MFQPQELKRLAPLFLFWAGYTIVFFLWVKTFFYTLPFLLGLLIATAIQPLIRFLEKKTHLGHTKASFLAAGAVMGAVLLCIIVLGTFAVKEISAFIVRASMDGFSQFSKPVAEFLSGIGRYLERFELKILEQNQKEIMDLLQNSWEMVLSFLNALLGVITSLPIVLTLVIVTIVSTFFIARDLEHLREWAKRVLSPDTASCAKSVTSRGTGKSYALSYLILYFITFCEAMIVLSILGIPYSLTLSLITAVADVLPVLGPGFVFLPLSIYQLLIGQYAKAAGLLIGWGVMSLIRQISEPKLVSNSVKIHPLAMLAAIYFSLVRKSIWLLFYVMFFFTLYSSLKGLGVLPPFFETDEKENGKGPFGKGETPEEPESS